MTRSRDTADTQDNLGGAVAPFVAGKNVLINGGFDIWQRGTSFTNPATSGTVFSADRWVAYFNGNGTITQETTVKPDTDTYSLKITATGTSADNAIYQLVEQVNMQQLRGKVVTLSVKLAGTVGLFPGIQLCYSTTANDGLFTTNTPISGTVISTPTINASTFVTYAVSYLIPTTAKTLRIGMNSGPMVNTNVVYVADFQLELGNLNTPFARAGGSIGGELALCQRYYQKSYNQSAFAGSANDNIGIKATSTSSTVANTGLVIPITFPVTMRSTPTATVYGYGGTVNNVSNGGGTDLGANTGIAIHLGQSGFNIQNQSSTITPSYNAFMAHYIASAEL